VRALYASEKVYLPSKGSKLEKETSRIEDYNEHVKDFNEHIKVYNEAVRAFNAKRFEEAISKAQEYLGIVATDDRAKELIELSYDGLSDQQIEKGNHSGAAAFLKQALAVEYKGSHKKNRAYTKHKYDTLMQKIKGTTGGAATEQR